MKTHQLLFFLVEWEKYVFFFKCVNHENKFEKKKLLQKMLLSSSSHFVYKFQKHWMKIKKKLKIWRRPLKTLLHINQNFENFFCWSILIGTPGIGVYQKIIISAKC